MIKKRNSLKDKLINNKFKKLKKNVINETKNNKISKADIDNSKIELVKQLDEFEEEAINIINVVTTYKSNFEINISKLEKESENGPMLKDVCSFIPIEIDNIISSLTTVKQHISDIREKMNTDDDFNMIDILDAVSVFDDFRLKIMNAYLDIQTMVDVPKENDTENVNTDIKTKVEMPIETIVENTEHDTIDTETDIDLNNPMNTMEQNSEEFIEK